MKEVIKSRATVANSFYEHMEHTEALRRSQSALSTNENKITASTTPRSIDTSTKEAHTYSEKEGLHQIECSSAT